MLSTGDLYHHGTQYGDKAINVFPITDKSGILTLKARVHKSLQLLDKKKYKDFIKYSYNVTHSDWFDVGILIRYIIGPMKSNILSVVPSDFSDLFKTKTPTYVLGALITINPINSFSAYWALMPNLGLGLCVFNLRTLFFNLRILHHCGRETNKVSR